MVSIIAEEYQIVLIIAQQDPCAGRLRREGRARIQREAEPLPELRQDARLR